MRIVGVQIGCFFSSTFHFMVILEAENALLKKLQSNVMATQPTGH